MTTNLDVWKLAAGLGIFLFGILLIEESVRSLSGRAFRRIIRMYTNGRLRSIGSGLLVTALLQSSSAVSLMVLAFVGAGVMRMENAIGVIMGSNIGTTLTAWIVATVGFQVSIESFALPFIGMGAVGLIFFRPATRLFFVSRLVIGFGFLFLGLDYMKGSVENFAQTFSLTQIPDYGPWFYLLAGAMATALMQASAAAVAIVLTALHSRLISFDIGAAMVIGANIGTTITVLLGAIGGVQAKKRVALSHLVFNAVTGAVAFFNLPGLIRFIGVLVDVGADSLTALALFHTLFNLLGVIIFFPFVGLLSRALIRLYPDYKTILTEYLDKTPAEVTDAADAALRKEVGHLLQECQLYNLRLLQIDEKLVFDEDTPFEKNEKRKYTLDELYENIKLLHAAIFTFYSKVQAQKLHESEAKELERVIYASRNIMNSIKNFKGIRLNMEEFDASENPYLNAQYKLFRKRLVELYHGMFRILSMTDREEMYRSLLKIYTLIEEADEGFIRNTQKAVADQKIHEMEIASLLLVNRLFTQSCRMQLYSMKDLLLTQDQVHDFDRAMDMKETMDAEKMKPRETLA
ncbi:Na/Pi cotransporter family protein [Desulfococcus multivorans]|uniref:Na+/Picotransporter n=1 Tax=Desulfococcus multivorans DSM 2059 TaxID=1121405 RepID=S7VFG1_DESML|nr:Na/Pi symporter [Desulfococcus multivorans]AOY58424.1 Na+/Pi-cotransporter [Desulfococcus multivorans]AQV00747.1 sodium:phosphate symporter [Desulfococcus multivorans]EPR43213.1 Na+/Picotransporter [Desulfococcus multivorans DSM 2059]SJZ40373.1 phosphate:Na+ symporter [Desulfococcus multivorans DSM 2059]